ncbi:hypothetical protein C8A01DRAFT_20912 [Parachaetomium inaequale]|uniref:Uncharacterized protein n=1 Tax=Parachaetomium inaequale TaxID=2588326 RepID=A0AAN6SLQ0_9PEZI|nr:hypothetical protein C8A01DRAFT_20912 [Parachaetomium inaequale]
MLRAIFTVALAFAATAIGCEQRCGVNQAQSNGNICTYDCHADSVRSAQLNAANFAGALRQKNYQCSSNAGQVICQKSGNFGGCGDHSWNTGRGC